MPLLWISIFLFLGLAAGKYLPWSAWGWLVLGGSFLLLWLVLPQLPERKRGLLARLKWLGSRDPRLGLPPILLLTILFLGAARFVLALPQRSPVLRSPSASPSLPVSPSPRLPFTASLPPPISSFNDTGTYRILAVVSDYPDVRDTSTQLRLSVVQVAALNDKGQPKAPVPARGLLLAMLPGKAGYQYGDRLLLEGKPVTPPENEAFSYREYLARQGVYTYLTYPRVEYISGGNGSPLLAAIFRLRDWAKAKIYHLYPAPEAPLLAGILLGLDSDLPPDLARAFQNTGTAHVIAISGFNIAILSALFASLFGKIVSRWWAIALSVIAITAYTLMVGATPSVVRAAIMGGMSLLAHAIGRRSAGLNTLFVTGGVMALINPHMPWDASFQLSFLATAGLIVFGDRFQSGFQALLARRFSLETARKITGPVAEYVLLTLAAQLMTLPVIVYHFQRLSLSSLLANPLILPPQPLVMVLSGLAVLAGAISDPLAHLLAWLAWPLSAYTIRMVELLDRIPGGVLVLNKLDAGTVVLLYAAILAPVLSRSLGDRLPAWIKAQIKPGILLWGAALVATLVWRAVFSAPDGRMHLTVMDIQHSQVLLIQGPRGERLLVNGGPSALTLNDALGRRISPLDQRLDGILVNSSTAGDVASLENILERYPPAKAWWGSALPEKGAGLRLVEAMQDQEVLLQTLAAGDVIAIGAQPRLEVIATSPEGSALLLTWDRFRVLIPNGIPLSDLPPEKIAGLSLLILDQRDLEESAPEDWLALAARAVLATPTEGEILASHQNWFNTIPDAWVTFSSDGKRMWIEQKRN